MNREFVQKAINELDLSIIHDIDNPRKATFSNKELLSSLQATYPDLIRSAKELIYWHMHMHEEGFIDEQFCPCGTRKKFDTIKFRYFKYCSPKCARIYTMDKAKETCLKRYGCTNPMKNEQIKNKAKATNVKKYGAEWGLLTNEIKQKVEQTCLDKYGTAHAVSSKQIRDKIDATNIEKYGYTSPMRNKEVQEKVKATNLKRYGCPASSQNEEVKKKMKETCLEKYGVECTTKVESVKKKSRETNLKRYGYENSMQSPQVREKAKQTNLERYGETNPMKSKEFQEKLMRNNLEKYGVRWQLELDSVRNKITETLKQKYGVDNISRFKPLHFNENTAKILSSPENLKAFIETQEIKTSAHMAKKLDMCITAFKRHCHEYGLWDLVEHYTSSYELELQSLFPNTFIKTKAIIPPYEIDLYNEEHKFGIEFNGNYWHSEQHRENPSYHQNKSLLAEEKGIFLYHIWEYEWLDERKRSIILSQINNLLGRNERKIYARQCELKEVSSEEAKIFLKENHLQGNTNASVKLGLYFGDEPVSLMTFGKPRFDKRWEYELIRFCNKKNTSVIGSASKLFKHFIKKYQPKSIYSYSHMDKGRGTLYSNLGFRLEKVTDPDYVWAREDNVLSRYQCQKYKLLKRGLVGDSEKEIMQGLGYFQLFSCGSKVWIFENSLLY
jgi:hypothetical protein